MSSPKHAAVQGEISMQLQSGPHYHHPPGREEHLGGGKDTSSEEDDAFIEQPSESERGKEHQADEMKSSRSRGFLLKTIAALLFTLLVLALGFIIGFFTHQGLTNTSSVAMTVEDRKLMHQQAIESVSQARLEEYERLHTSQQCPIGSTTCTGNLTHTIVEQLTAMGFKVSVSTYNVLVSYPNTSRASSLKAVDSQSNTMLMIDLYGEQGDSGLAGYQLSPRLGQVLSGSSGGEGVLVGSGGDDTVTVDTHQPAMPVYMPFSASGLAKGDLVFVNYGRETDFTLIAEVGVNVSGKIGLARQGQGSAYDQVNAAASHGMVGLLLYPDPTDMNFDMAMTSVMTPDLSGMMGDPQTPGCPSVDGIYRSSMDSLDIPSIPVQPVSMATASMLLANLTGVPAEGLWVGGLNVTYHIGLAGTERQPWSLELDIHNDIVQEPIHDVVATIQGSQNPDQYVLLGGHYSSMMTSMVTPGSLSAVMESASVVSGMLGSGWMPRRTVMIGLWEGSEFGFSGSTEWAQENHMLLRDRAVAYIDLAGDGGNGSILNTQASPLLQGVIMAAADQLGLSSMVDIGVLDGSGDHVPFSHMIGIPSASISVASSQGSSNNVSPTASGMVMLMSSAQLSTQVILSLADDELLGLDAVAMADTVMTYVDNLDSVIGGMMAAAGGSVHMTMLKSAAGDFMSAVQDLQSMISSGDTINSPVTMTMVNTRLMYMERSFIDTGSSSVLGSVLYGMQVTDTFSTVSGMMVNNGNVTMTMVEQTLSRLQCTIQSASSSLAMSIS